MTDDLLILPGLTIPREELTFSTSRSGGPGGQHVNKTSTRVTLTFNLAASPSLDRAQKERVAARLSSRLTAEGLLRVTAGKERSQLANRRAAEERFTELLRDALAEEPDRVETKPTRASRQRRLDAKRRRGLLKRDRTSYRGPSSATED